VIKEEALLEIAKADAEKYKAEKPAIVARARPAGAPVGNGGLTANGSGAPAASGAAPAKTAGGGSSRLLDPERAVGFGPRRQEGRSGRSEFDRIHMNAGQSDWLWASLA